MFYLDDNDAGGKTIKELRLPKKQFSDAVLGFALDADKEIYVLTNETGILSGTTGKVLKIVPGR